MRACVRRRRPQASRAVAASPASSSFVGCCAQCTHGSPARARSRARALFFFPWHLPVSVLICKRAVLKKKLRQPTQPHWSLPPSPSPKNQSKAITRPAHAASQGHQDTTPYKRTTPEPTDVRKTVVRSIAFCSLSMQGPFFCSAPKTYCDAAR